MSGVTGVLWTLTIGALSTDLASLSAGFTRMPCQRFKPHGSIFGTRP